MNDKPIVVNVGDYVGTEFGNGLIQFIGKEYLILAGGDGNEYCIHRKDGAFWLPVDINWEE